MMYALLMYADPAHTRGASGELRGGAGLVLPDETTVVRDGSDGVVTSQGPLVADTPQHLTAYYEVDCETPERAHEVAAHILDDHVIAVEVRRIHDTA
jgi:hypothetical protein